jgi:hypothetical protein
MQRHGHNPFAQVIFNDDEVPGRGKLFAQARIDATMPFRRMPITLYEDVSAYPPNIHAFVCANHHHRDHRLRRPLFQPKRAATEDHPKGVIDIQVDVELTDSDVSIGGGAQGGTASRAGHGLLPAQAASFVRAVEASLPPSRASAAFERSKALAAASAAWTLGACAVFLFGCCCLTVAGLRMPRLLAADGRAVAAAALGGLAHAERSQWGPQRGAARRFGGHSLVEGLRTSSSSLKAYFRNRAMEGPIG